MRRRRIVGFVACILGALTLLGTGCSNEDQPLRIGMLVDCGGLFAQSRELSMAAVSLPLIERGAKIAEGGIVNGIEDARVAGRDVELLSECTEFTYVHRLIAATRRLVEERGAEIVIGPIGSPDGMVFRDLAERYPDVTFLHGITTAQEATLRDAPENQLRFAPDGAQTTAGLGTYAYRDLGWRSAVVVGELYSDGWDAAAGFIAEFCALGGKVVERDWFALFPNADPKGSALRHAATADGVLLLSEYSPVSPYLSVYGREATPLATSLVVGGSWFSTASGFELPGLDLTGVVRAGFIPLVEGAAAMAAYRSSFERAFPGLGASAGEPLAVPRYTAMTAVVRALESTGGELGDGQAEFREALRTIDPGAPFGHVTIDENGQAIAPSYLERVDRAAGRTVMRPVRTVDAVDQGFGGLFTGETAPPSAVDPPCVAGSPPPWAS